MRFWDDRKQSAWITKFIFYRGVWPWQRIRQRMIAGDTIIVQKMGSDRSVDFLGVWDFARFAEPLGQAVAEILCQ